MYQDIMQVCMKGHQINTEYNKYPEDNKKYCTKCRSATITSCPKCNTSILGRNSYPGIAFFNGIPVPSNCHECGKKYPWNTVIYRLKDLLRGKRVFTKDKIVPAFISFGLLLGVFGLGIYYQTNQFYIEKNEIHDYNKVLKDSVSVLKRNNEDLEKSIKELEFEKESYKHQKEVYNNALIENGIVIDTSN